MIFYTIFLVISADGCGRITEFIVVCLVESLRLSLSLKI